MTVANAFFMALAYGALGLVVIIFAYVLVRGVSIAHYRTKFEYMRKLMRSTRGDKNGL